MKAFSIFFSFTFYSSCGPYWCATRWGDQYNPFIKLRALSVSARNPWGGGMRERESVMDRKGGELLHGRCSGRIVWETRVEGTRQDLLPEDQPPSHTRISFSKSMVCCWYCAAPRLSGRVTWTIILARKERVGSALGPPASLMIQSHQSLITLSLLTPHHIHHSFLSALKCTMPYKHQNKWKCTHLADTL